MRRTSKAATAGSTKRRAGRKPALLLVSLAACVAALVVVVGPASGATTRFLVEVFGSSAQPAFPGDRGMAVDQATGELYVLEVNTDEVRRYNADGTPSNFGALGTNAIDGEGAGDETPDIGLDFPSSRSESQIAIDESGGATDGNIYVTEKGRDQVSIFASNGEYLGELTEHSGGAFNEPLGVAVDPLGNVYVGDFSAADEVHKYEPAANPPVNADNTASFNSLAGTSSIGTLAAGAGASAGFIFVNRFNGEMLKLDATTGELKYQVTTGAATSYVDPGTGHVFAVKGFGTSSSIDEYDASGAGSATLVSSFKPGSTAEGVAVNSANEEVYAARASTENVEVFGPAAVLPDVVTQAPASNTGTRATLAGTVNPDGVELDECFFEWTQNPFEGAPASYGNAVPCAETPAEIGAGTTPVPVEAELTGLVPHGTRYHYRLVATNPNGTVNGANQNFTTPNTVITQAASGVTPTEATLNGTVNPDTASISECVFEWGPEKEPLDQVQTFPEAAPCVPGPGGITGTGPVAVEADISGLHPGTTYLYRLKAGYPTGPITASTETVQTTGPVIKAAWAEDVIFTEAILKTEINPEGSATTYHIEYGETEAYGSETPELNVGSDTSFHELSRFLDDLEPGTTYHYRVVATNADATNEGPDQTFTTYERSVQDTDCPNQKFRVGASANLPDCRAYEMVSPVDKNASDILVSTFFFGEPRQSFNQASVEGNRITYSSSTSFGDQVSSRGSNQYIATRRKSGWSTHGINAPVGQMLLQHTVDAYSDVFSQFKLFTPDLSSGWLIDFNTKPLTDDASEGWPNLYRRDNRNESYEALTRDAPTSARPGFEEGFEEEYSYEVQAHSRDFSHVVFDVPGALTPDAAATPRSQVYDFTDGELHLVSVLPDGTPFLGHSSAGTDDTRAFSDYRGMTKDAISEDGSRIFWTGHVGLALNPSRTGTLYVRENPAEPQSTLNASNECTEPAKACTRLIAPGNESLFWTASADGSEVIYSIGEPSISGEGEDEDQLGVPLNRFDVDAETVTQLAPRAGGVVGASDDLSHVYFTSKADLAPGATTGDWNLYLDQGGTKTFIATLSPDDRNTPEIGNDRPDGIDSFRSLAHAARVTPDGQHLTFMSNRSLTGYDNTDAVNGKANMEVFLYDAATDDLTCVSCNPSGARPVGQEMLRPYSNPLLNPDPTHGPTKRWAGAWLQTWVHNVYASRVLSEDGDRLFFNSFDALAPEDTNGAQDVYQWERQGTGSCQEPSGCVSLISTGKSPERSEFIDATPDGEEVFFETSSSIDPRDPGLIDIYVARVNGGFPVPPSPPGCVGDACQSVPEAPDDPTPASAGFRGAGNPVPQRNCGAAARRASKLSRRAKRLRRRATRFSSPRQGKRLRRRAVRTAKKAKRVSRSAKRCRRADRRASR